MEEAGCHFVISQASKAGRHRGGGRGAAGSEGLQAPCPAFLLASSPGAQLLQEEGAQGKQRNGGGNVGRAFYPIACQIQCAGFRLGRSFMVLG